MIVEDHKIATLVRASFLSVSLLASLTTVALADDFAASPAPAAAAAASSTEDAAPASVTLVADGAESTFSTRARTVAELLAERGIAVADGDFVSPGPADPVSSGDRIVVRTAIPVRIALGTARHGVRSSAASVGELLRDERIRVGPSDVVEPGIATPLLAGETVRIVRIASWTSHERSRIAPATVAKTDRRLPLGRTETVANGASGERDTLVRFTRRDDGAPERTVLASRVIREPHARVIVRGLATYASLARMATQGFVSAVHMAGSALHMIATAYTANCFGCSGMTASGVRAGFGVIAVDPSVVPLGTKVFIPGYGRAVAGDTGGAILGHRVDLGFDSQTAALNFGRRSVTLYVLR